MPVITTSRLADGTSVTEMSVVRIEHTWLVKNFTSWPSSFSRRCVESATFSADDHPDSPKWCLSLYPHGDKTGCENFISLYVKLVSFSKASSLDASIEISVKKSTCRYYTGNLTKSFTASFDLAATRSWGYSTFAPYYQIFRNYRTNEHLSICCQISYADGKYIVSKSLNIDVPPGEPGVNLKSLLKKGNFADVSLVVEGVFIPAHMAVLAARSPVFQAMFEHDLVERAENKVEICDIKASVMQELLNFIYTDTAPNADLMAADLLIAAEKYDLGRLKLICEQILSRNLTVENVGETLRLADRHNANQLKEKCMYFIRTNADEVSKSLQWKDVARQESSMAMLDCYITSSLPPSSEEVFVLPPDSKRRRIM